MLDTSQTLRVLEPLRVKAQRIALTTFCGTRFRSALKAIFWMAISYGRLEVATKDAVIGRSMLRPYN